MKVHEFNKIYNNIMGAPNQMKKSMQNSHESGRLKQ